MKRFVLFICLFLSVSGANAQQHPFRFAWLTDTHIGSQTGEEDLRASVRDINSLSGISFVILSGDVTEMGETVELTLARRILDSLRVPYHVIPGNHDTKWSESGCSEFARLWKDDKFVFDVEGVTFIGCSSGPNMRQGDGHVPEEDVRWLDSIVTRIGSSARPVIFVLHYPLDEQLDNWYEIIGKLKRVNTIAALCGHGHQNQRLDFEGVPGVMARSNLRAKRAVGGYTLVDVRKDSLVFTERTPVAGEPAAGLSAAPAGKQWHAIANTRHAYRLDTAHYKRPDFSINTAYPQVRESWKTETGYTIGVAPAVAGTSTVIVGNNKGRVEAYALSNGRKLWSYQTGGSVYSTAAVAPWIETGRDIQNDQRSLRAPDGAKSGEKTRVSTDAKAQEKTRAPQQKRFVRARNGLRAVVGSSDGVIYCFDANEGRVLWRYQALGPVVASPLIADSVVYIGSSDGTFRALSLAHGELVWEYKGIEKFVESTPLLYEGRIIFGAWDTHLYALDAATGALLWKWSNGKPTRNLSPAACTPVASAGKVFIVAPDRYTTAIDAATGRTVWRSAAHQVREMIGISEDKKTVYARTLNDTLVAFASAPDSLSLEWSVDCRYGYDFAPSMPVEKDGSVFFGTKNGLVVCVDAHTRTLKWVHKISNTVVSTVTPLSSRECVATSMNGAIVRLTSEN